MEIQMSETPSRQDDSGGSYQESVEAGSDKNAQVAASVNSDAWAFEEIEEKKTVSSTCFDYYVLFVGSTIPRQGRIASRKVT